MLIENNRINCKEIYDEYIDLIKTDLKYFNKNMLPKILCVYDNDDFATSKYIELKQKTAMEVGLVIDVVKGMNGLNKFIHKNELDHTVYYILQQPMKDMRTAIAMMNDYMNDTQYIDIDYFSHSAMMMFDERDYARIADEYAENIESTIISKLINTNVKIPATANGALEIIKRILGNDLSGKKIAIVGCRSKTVGRYLPQLLLNMNASVLLCHSKTELHDNIFEDYDCVVSCVGSEGIISARHFGNNTGCVCIDIGVSRGSDNKVKGDFSTDIRDKQLYTPYVNGMGLLTRIFLINNYIFELFHELHDCCSYIPMAYHNTHSPTYMSDKIYDIKIIKAIIQKMEDCGDSDFLIKNILTGRFSLLEDDDYLKRYIEDKYDCITADDDDF